MNITVSYQTLIDGRKATVMYKVSMDCGKPRSSSGKTSKLIIESQGDR